MRKYLLRIWVLAAVVVAQERALVGWDYDGHRAVNLLALQSLPTNFPAFVFQQQSQERIAFLAGEPDRWRNTPDISLRHFNGPDHYFDFEELPHFGLGADTASPFRYDFVAQIASARAANPDTFPKLDPVKDTDHTKWLIGFLPWTITEYQGKLKSAFSYLREFEQAGTAEEISNAQRNTADLMGVMGHFVGDGAQPLHTTKHYNGWVGDNPNRYTTNRNFHSWIDGGYLQRGGIDLRALRAKLRPARIVTHPESHASPTNVFSVVWRYLQTHHQKVEPLYRLEQAGKLSATAEISQEAHQFLTDQIVSAAQMLGDLWLTAWQQAPVDTYLRSSLARRKLGQINGGDNSSGSGQMPVPTK